LKVVQEARNMTSKQLYTIGTINNYFTIKFEIYPTKFVDKGPVLHLVTQSKEALTQLFIIP